MIIIFLTTIGAFLFLRIILYNFQTYWIIENFPPLWTLRNPLKLQLTLLLSILPLFAFSLENFGKIFLSTLNKKKIKTSIILTLTITAILTHQYIYNSFVFNGYMGLDKSLNGSLQKISPNPVLLNIISDFSMSNNKSLWRGIILPFDHKTELHVQFNNPLIYPARYGLKPIITEKFENAFIPVSYTHLTLPTN